MAGGHKQINTARMLLCYLDTDNNQSRVIIQISILSKTVRRFVICLYVEWIFQNKLILGKLNLRYSEAEMRTFLFLFSTQVIDEVSRRSDQGVTKLNEGPLATAAIIHIYCHLYLLSTISYWYNTTRLLIHPNPPRPNHCCPWQPWALKECCISKLIYISRDLIIAENLIGLPGED